MNLLLFLYINYCIITGSLQGYEKSLLFTKIHTPKILYLQTIIAPIMYHVFFQFHNLEKNIRDSDCFFYHLQKNIINIRNIDKCEKIVSAIIVDLIEQYDISDKDRILFQRFAYCFTELDHFISLGDITDEMYQRKEVVIPIFKRLFRDTALNFYDSYLQFKKTSLTKGYFSEEQFNYFERYV